ncbi:MAG: UvrD-helicase domain-containing protein [Spirochaetes bacterium]|nr:UvrD-helicase domain-containing protein [Spirochaetota bacterium]
MSILDSLNESQKKAVIHTDGPLLILAGAGSGKTRVITHRIARLIGDGVVPPTGIFAVTFTNKATEEMKNRIVRLIGPQGSSVFIKTFHAASVYILRRYGEAIGIPSSFSIYDTSDQASLIKEILLQMRLDPKKIRPESIASKISEVKDRAELIDGADPTLLLQKNFSYDFHEIYEEYHRRLAANNALDFNDLLIKTVHLLRSGTGALERLQRQWTYFMIDEYQDTNYAQYLIAKHLASAGKNICVVGDDDQSIYSWRGADIRNILNFEKDYPGAAVVTLDTNYRSTRPILDAASSVIRNNVNRKAKEIRSHKGDGERVVWCRANNEYGEAEFVVNTIISLKHREGLSGRDFAVFYRTNAQSRVFEDRLRKENIPYRVVGGMKFYERKEIKDLLAYLKFIANPLDQVSMLRIINTPARGVGRVALERIRETARGAGVSEWTAISEGLIGGKIPRGIAEFRDIILKCRDSARGMPETRLSDFVEQVIEESRYVKSLEEEESVEARSRIENIGEFVNSVYDYQQANPDATLDGFLQDISLYTTEENPEDDPDSRGNQVTLMTVHNAKGLEFPVVFLTGMEEDIFPHKLSSDTEEGIEEERRLCYVGITRAMERIYITCAELRRTFNEIYHKEPSRFIFEIPGSLIEATEYISAGYQSAQPRRGFFEKKVYNESHFDVEPDDSIDDDNTPEASNQTEGPGESKFRVRDSVLHPKYGVGRILSIEGSGDNLKITILFGRSSKTFLEKYTPLEKA